MLDELFGTQSVLNHGDQYLTNALTELAAEAMNYFNIYDQDFYQRHGNHPEVEATQKTPRELEKITFTKLTKFPLEEGGKYEKVLYDNVSIYYNGLKALGIAGAIFAAYFGFWALNKLWVQSDGVDIIKWLHDKAQR